MDGWMDGWMDVWMYTYTYTYAYTYTYTYIMPSHVYHVPRVSRLNCWLLWGPCSWKQNIKQLRWKSNFHVAPTMSWCACFVVVQKQQLNNHKTTNLRLCKNCCLPFNCKPTGWTISTSRKTRQQTSTMESARCHPERLRVKGLPQHRSLKFVGFAMAI